ncbi:MAG TPA: hypothetical protein PKY25_02070 [Bacilli bacterium]|nr:hypothetical protein [Bacilli bacterium]
MIKKIRKWLSANRKNKVGRPKLATDKLIRAAKMEAVLAFVLCSVLVLSGAGVLTNKNPLALLGLTGQSKLSGDVISTKKEVSKICPTDYIVSSENKCKKIVFSYTEIMDVLKEDGTKCFDKTVTENKNYNGTIYRNKQENSGRYCYDKYVYVEKCPKDYYKYGSRCRKTTMYIKDKICPAGYIPKSDTDCEINNN